MQHRVERTLDELVQLNPSRDHLPHLGGDAIPVEALAKTYRDGTEAVRAVTFRVAAGECYGLLGPNGAGTSTTVGMLGTLVRPTSGRANVAGFDVVAQPPRSGAGSASPCRRAASTRSRPRAGLLVLQGRLHGLRRGTVAHASATKRAHAWPRARLSSWTNCGCPLGSVTRSRQSCSCGKPALSAQPLRLSPPSAIRRIFDGRL
jgi:energy-coupling factor transporter ATP-binding protein EcfA2